MVHYEDETNSSNNPSLGIPASTDLESRSRAISKSSRFISRMSLPVSLHFVLFPSVHLHSNDPSLAPQAEKHARVDQVSFNAPRAENVSRILIWRSMPAIRQVQTKNDTRACQTWANNTLVLMYMATQEDDKRRRRGSGSSHTHHSAHVRGRHVFSDTTPSPQHQGNGWVSQFWSQVGALQADLPQGAGSKDHASLFPYSITDFSMRVDNDDQAPHYFTQMSSSTPLCNLELKDHALWRHQFSEFDFLQSQMQDWPRTGRKVLVCDASIKVLTEARPNADLSITFNLDSRRDLTGFEYLECISRFYDGGNIAPDPKFDGANSNYLKEQRMPCVYMPGSYGSSGSLRLAFGSKFWVNRMLKYQNIRNKDKGSVNRSLRYLTATQDICAIERGTGRVECIMTILWRFSPTKSSEEEGSMTWRSFSFRGDSTTEAEHNWTMGNTPYHGSGVEAVNRSQEQSQNYPLPASTEQTFFSPTSQPPPSFHHPQYNSFPQPLQLPVEALASMNPGNDPYNVSPSSTSSFSSISDPYTNQDMFSTHVQMPEYAFTNNSSHTSLPSSAFSPAIQVPEYNPFAAHNAESTRGVYPTSSGTASTNSPAFVHPGHHSCGNSPTVVLALPTSNPNLPPSTGTHHMPVAVAYPSPSTHHQHPSPPHYQAQNLLSVTSNQEHIFHAYHPPHLAPHSPHPGAVFPQPLTTQREQFQGENLVPSSSELQSGVSSHEVWSVPPPIAVAPAPRSLGSHSEGEEREGWEGG